MQVTGVAAFLKEKVTMSQSEGTHQFLSPEYHRLFTNKKKQKKQKQKKPFWQRGGGWGRGESMGTPGLP